MSQLCNIARCKDCEQKSKNKPFNWGEDAEFCVVIEWLTKDEALKKIKGIKCPKCGSDNWYFTDAIEH